MTQQVQTYRERSRAFLVKAREELLTGDLEQASEKAWGAAAQIVKAVADARGLSHRHHNSLRIMVETLTRETADNQLGVLFDVANALHSNFYENVMDQEGIEWRLRRVADFVARLERLLPEAE